MVVSVGARSLFHRRFGHLNVQLAQFSPDSWCSPGGIRASHVLAELADLLSKDRSSRLTALAEPPPGVTEALLPGHHDVGLDKHYGVLPARPSSLFLAQN